MWQPKRILKLAKFLFFFTPRARETPRARGVVDDDGSLPITAAVQPRQSIAVWAIRRRPVLRGHSFPSRMRDAADNWD